AIKRADTRLWTTAPLNLWTAPGKDAKKVGLIDDLERVLVTGRRAAGRVELVIGGKARWVTAGYLAAKKPVPPPPPAPERSSAPSGSSSRAAAAPASCTNGTSVPSGVSPNVVKVHEAVCAAFPEISTYGTFRSDGEHSQGLAVDIMVSGSRGQQVADFVRANYSGLGVNYIIYAQQIWSVDRAGEGWRSMEDRGSTTANHFDHVHVTTY
ncbi:MAG TPA: SH3 domain-containing protein, partial [Nocardioides sp.]|nr:SH3 domain-containing protein [Nocardioides sp.]